MTNLQSSSSRMRGFLRWSAACLLFVIAPLSFAEAKPPASIAERCAPFYPSGWQAVSGQHLPTEAPSRRPAKGEPFPDADYRTCVVRVTAHDIEPPKGLARNDYSRRQAFNADSSRLLVSALDGDWHLYDARTLAYVTRLRGLGGDAEPQWHPTDPNLLYYLPTYGVGMKLFVLDVRTGESREAADFASRIKAHWPSANSVSTRSEGAPSRDGRYWAFQVDSGDWQGLGLFTFDLQENHIIAAYDLASHGKARPDHISMSLSGNYVVVSWNDGPVAFTRDFKNPVKLQKQGNHSDLALTAEGDDAYVAIDYEVSGGPLFMVNLRTGARTVLFDTYVRKTTTGLHVSGRAYKRPGWVVVSTYAEAGVAAPQWLHGKIMAVELKARPRVINLARHQVNYNKYFTAPLASVNPDFTRILFNSNWGTRSETDVDTYMILLPPDLLR